MSSTTSDDIEIGTAYYVPFWILLEFLDNSPPDPFVEVKVLAVDTKYGTGPDGPVEIQVCDLMCDGKRQLVAHGIPAEYLIAPDNLHEWANKIADWFRDFKKPE
jgi:hypothetical protein